MAIYEDERRTSGDRIQGARDRYDDASSGSKVIGFLVALALVGFIVYMLFGAMNTRTTGDAIRNTPQNPVTTTAPRTATPPANTTTSPTPKAPTTQPQ